MGRMTVTRTHRDGPGQRKRDRGCGVTDNATWAMQVRSLRCRVYTPHRSHVRTPVSAALIARKCTSISCGIGLRSDECGDVTGERVCVSARCAVRCTFALC